MVADPIVFVTFFFVIWYLVKYGVFDAVGKWRDCAALISINLLCLVAGLVIWGLSSDCTEESRTAGFSLAIVSIVALSLDLFYDSVHPARHNKLRCSPGLVGNLSPLLHLVASSVSVRASSCEVVVGPVSFALICLIGVHGLL